MCGVREEAAEKIGGQRSEGNLSSSPHSIPQVWQRFSVGCRDGFHPPARIGSFCRKHLGPQKSCNGSVEKDRALFYAKKQDNEVSAAKGSSGKFFICIVSKAASPAAHRGETNTWKQQQKMHLN